MTTSPPATLKLASTIAAAAFLLGCASGHTFVLQAHRPGPAPMSFALKEGASTVEVQPELRDYFRTALATRLERGSMLKPAESAPDLIVEYRFVAFDAGKAGARVVNTAIQVVGVPVSGIGDGNLGVDVVYRNRDGRALSQIVADGPIAGLFGSSRSGLDTAAASIAAYTQETFQEREVSFAERPG